MSQKDLGTSTSFSISVNIHLRLRYGEDDDLINFSNRAGSMGKAIAGKAALRMLNLIPAYNSNRQFSWHILFLQFYLNQLNV